MRVPERQQSFRSSLTTGASSGTFHGAHLPVWDWLAPTSCNGIQSKLALHIKIFLRCGKTPTPVSLSLSKPRRSTRSCSSLLLRHSNLRLFGRQSERRCLYRISPVIQHTVRTQNGASDKLSAH